MLNRFFDRHDARGKDLRTIAFLSFCSGLMAGHTSELPNQSAFRSKMVTVFQLLPMIIPFVKYEVLNHLQLEPQRINEHLHEELPITFAFTMLGFYIGQLQAAYRFGNEDQCPNEALDYSPSYRGLR